LSEKRIKEGLYKGPLDGIPFSVKDNIYVNGLKCTAGSKILEQFYPMRDASCVDVLRKAGAIVLGTTNMNEFASGITGVNPIYGSSRNPWNKEHISGGSSGGSCVSVSAGMVAFSIGTDTGGSIRVPASFCGVAGLKPTYGKISSEGVIALAPSLDHIGIITRNVIDTSTIFKIITNLNRDDGVKIYNYRGSTIRKTMSNRKKIVIGCPDNYFLNDLNPRILKCFERFIETITSLGYRVKNISLNATEKIERAWTTIRLAEASEQHAKFQRKSSEYSDEVATMLKMGKKIPAVRYIQSCKFRSEMIKICDKIFSTIQIMITPTTPITAPSFAAIEDPKKSLEIRQLLLRNVIPFNLIGFPALNIPLGLDKNNVPIGAQLIGKPNCEDQILLFANDIQNKKNYKFIPRI
jgi:aspartyl-tRNA(Asn)/glutamyl-tRNA(Gln) amidotransferase subunit A